MQKLKFIRGHFPSTQHSGLWRGQKNPKKNQATESSVPNCEKKVLETWKERLRTERSRLRSEGPGCVMWHCTVCWSRPKISPQQAQRSTKLLVWERNSWKNSARLTIAAGTMDYSLVTCPSKLTLGCSRHPACLYKSIAGLVLLSPSVILGQTWIQSVLLCFSHSEPKKSKRHLRKRAGFVAVTINGNAWEHKERAELLVSVFFHPGEEHARDLSVKPREQ